MEDRKVEEFLEAVDAADRIGERVVEVIESIEKRELTADERRFVIAGAFAGWTSRTDFERWLKEEYNAKLN